MNQKAFEMNNKTIGIVVAAAILILLGYMMYSGGPVVSATGTAQIKAVPDVVSVYINVETRNSTAALANEANQRISEDLLAALVLQGFDRDELQFVNYNVYPEYDWIGNRQSLRGYVVSQQLVVKTENVNEVPSVVDASISSGALVSYINFELSEEKQAEYKKKALEQASADARDKASAIASGQGRGLGRLVSVQNQDYYYPGPIAFYDKAMAESATGGAPTTDSARIAVANISPQELEITASITAQYRLGLF